MLIHPMLANVIVDTFIQGGPIMWPLLVCFVAALAVVLERCGWWWLLGRRCDARELDQAYDAVIEGRFAEALRLSEKPGDPFLATLNAGLRNAHTSLLGAMQIKATDEIDHTEKRLWLLGTFITLAPLLGLLGTVTGIMHSFNFVGDDQLAASKVSGGIAEALIATACGLGIAILCLIPFNYLNRKLAQFRSRLEKVINHTELTVQSVRQHGHDLEEFARRQAVVSSGNRVVVEPAPHIAAAPAAG